MSRRKRNQRARPPTTPPGRLRIVAGKWRSRVLAVADEPGLRPTAERVRETLFNWLAPRIDGMRCLDLFAGTGALGLEALSRGAAAVTFVERSARAAATLERNVATLEAEGAGIVRGDANDFLRREQGERYELVFLDPPFAADCTAELCRLLAGGNLLAAGALVYIEEDRARLPAEIPGHWQVVKSASAGNVRYSLLSTGGGNEE